MARLFQTEKSRMKNSGQQPARQKDEAEFLRVSLTAKKQSLLPIGNLHIILCIFNGNMIFKHKKNSCVSEFDEEDNDDDEEEDDKEDEDYEEK